MRRLPQIHDTSYSCLARVVSLVVYDRTSGDGSTPSRLRTRSPCFLYPAILSTCKSVHGEATAILYGDNTFKCWIHHYSYFEPNEWDFDVAEQWKMVFKYDDKNRGGLDSRLLLRKAAFFCFLNRIGPRNAASLKAIAVEIPHYNNDMNQFQLVANLLERHLLGLKSIVVIGSWHRPRTSPLSVNEGKEFKQLCRILTNFVRGCRSLESFHYRGGDFDSVPDLEKSECLGELGQLLKERKEKKAPQLESTLEKEEQRF